MNTATQLLKRCKGWIAKQDYEDCIDSANGTKLLKDIEAYLAKQQQDSTFEIYEVWMGRIKFAAFATREQADAVVNSTAPSVRALSRRAVGSRARASC